MSLNPIRNHLNEETILVLSCVSRIATHRSALFKIPKCSGLRFGSPKDHGISIGPLKARWISRVGSNILIADVLKYCVPSAYDSNKGYSCPDIFEFVSLAT